MNDLGKLVKENLGTHIKGSTPTYQKAYPAYSDMVQYPHNYGVPDFAKFSKQDNTTTWRILANI